MAFKAFWHLLTDRHFELWRINLVTAESAVHHYFTVILSSFSNGFPQLAGQKLSLTLKTLFLQFQSDLLPVDMLNFLFCFEGALAEIQRVADLAAEF